MLKHLSLHNLLSDHQYGFREGHSTGDLLSFLIKSWSPCFRDFCETFVVSLDITKAFDRVWYKALISNLPSYGFYPSLCNFISSFLSESSIAAVVNSDCSSPKSINSDVPQGSVLSPILPYYPFLHWWYHPAFFYVFSKTSNPSGSQQLSQGSHRTSNFGSF